MPLDGNDNSNEWLPLMTPYAHHPNAPATGRALSYSLKQSYLYSRTQARFIGAQTYRQYNFTSIANTRTISGTDWIAIAEFRVDLPPHANYVQCTAYFNMLGAEGQRARVNHRIVVTDSLANTDTGSTFTSDYDVVPPVDFGETGPANPVWTNYDNGALIERFSVQRANTLDASAMRECTINAQAYAVDVAAGGAVLYKPGAIYCEWVTIG